MSVNLIASDSELCPMDVAGSSNQQSKLLVLAEGDGTDGLVGGNCEGDRFALGRNGNEGVEWLDESQEGDADGRPLVEAVVVVVIVSVVGVGGDGIVPVSVPVSVPFRHVGQVDVSAVADGRHRCHRCDKNKETKVGHDADWFAD